MCIAYKYPGATRLRFFILYFLGVGYVLRTVGYKALYITQIMRNKSRNSLVSITKSTWILRSLLTTGKLSP